MTSSPKREEQVGFDALRPGPVGHDQPGVDAVERSLGDDDGHLLDGRNALEGLVHVCSCQMQPRGLGMPAILAATFAGPLGNSWYSSLIETPDVFPSTRTVGPLPLARYSARMNRMTCQWRSVSTSMPSRRASSGVI